MNFLNVENLLSNIPLIKLNFCENNEVYCLMEKFNFTGSIKVKTVYWILKIALEKGELYDNKIILEASSGNTAISLAFFANLLKIPLIIILPRSTASCKKILIKSYGAQLIEIDGITDDCIKVRNEMYHENPHKYFLPDQFGNYNNFRAHYNLTGKNIWDRLGKIDFFCAGLGTSGTLLGAGQFLKEKNNDIQIVAVNPIEKIEGLRNFKTSQVKIPFYQDNKVIINETFDINYNEALQGVKTMLKEGYFVGISSGAIVSGVAKYLQNKENLKGAIIAPDGGDFYLETLIKEISHNDYLGCK